MIYTTVQNFGLFNAFERSLMFTAYRVEISFHLNIY